MTRIGLHLSWPLLADALRDAHNRLRDAHARLRDADWNGLDTTAARSEVRHMEMEQRNGVQYAVPF